MDNRTVYLEISPRQRDAPVNSFQGLPLRAPSLPYCDYRCMDDARLSCSFVALAPLAHGCMGCRLPGFLCLP